MLQKIRIRSTVDLAHAIRTDAEQILNIRRVAVDTAITRSARSSPRRNRYRRRFSRIPVGPEKKAAHIMNGHDVRIPHEQRNVVQRQVNQIGS